MTAAPELSETQTITHSRVESSLARPETRDQERFFMKTEAVAVEQSTGYAALYNLNLFSRFF